VNRNRKPSKKSNNSDKGRHIAKACASVNSVNSVKFRVGIRVMIRNRINDFLHLCSARLGKMSEGNNVKWGNVLRPFYSLSTILADAANWECKFRYMDVTLGDQRAWRPWGVWKQRSSVSLLHLRRRRQYILFSRF